MQFNLMNFDTDSRLLFSSKSGKSVPIHRLRSITDLPKSSINWANSVGFTATSGEVCLVPDKSGVLSSVLFGLGDDSHPLLHGKLARHLPSGIYHFAESTNFDSLGWAMGGYDYTRYKKRTTEFPRLVSSGDRHIIEGVYMARDLINTPANDMTPTSLEQATRKLAKHHGATLKVIKGEKLLKENFPLIHAVGRASSDAPRLLEFNWGKPSSRKVTLVGKGVTFDTGGLNLKPGNSMSLMKKDMGGAANVLGLAHMIMSAKLPIRLRVLIGAVENSVSSSSYRPGDILRSRKGLSVEIGNTDAEGRLVLADCLSYADEQSPDHLIDMATLTGAARIAMGPDIVPFYTTDDNFADSLMRFSEESYDPLWRLPLWSGYDSYLSSKVADINHINTVGVSFAGSITASLFLRRFVDRSKVWSHLDMYGWNSITKPWGPIGGEAQGIRALFYLLKSL